MNTVEFLTSTAIRASVAAALREQASGNLICALVEFAIAERAPPGGTGDCKFGRAAA